MFKKIFSIVLVLGFALLIFSPALALPCKTGSGEVCLDNHLPVDSPQKLIGQVIKGVLGLVGSLALAMFVYGGFTWMLAAGNSTNVEKGKQILIWATIGLIVIFSSYALVQFVFKDVLGVT